MGGEGWCVFKTAINEHITLMNSNDATIIIIIITIIINNDLEVTQPHSGSVAHNSWSKWNLKMLVFEERRKPEYQERNLSEQRREPTTNSTHIWRRRRDLNAGHIGGRRALSPLRHPCSPRGISLQRILHNRDIKIHVYAKRQT